jgi:hypothetical protein
MLYFIKKLLRSKSLILSIVLIFSLIIIGLIIQIIFLYRDIRSSSLHNNSNIHNRHHHHNENYHYHSHLKSIDSNEEENINVEKVRGKSNEQLRHRIEEKRKNLKLNDNDVYNNKVYNFTKISPRLRKNDHHDHTKILKAHNISKTKHYNDKYYKKNKTNFIRWYVTSLIQIVMSLIKFLYSTITIFSLKTVINDDQSTSLYSNDNMHIPYIIQLWRQAKLDWHTLIPKHDSSFERYYNDNNETSKDLQLTVLKERSITDYLTRYHESGLSAKYGHDHGKLDKYFSCDILSSGCMIHNQKECISNQLCYWDTEADICNEVNDNHSNINSNDYKCKYPKMLSINGTIVNANHSQCISYTNQKAVITTLESESQLMFYHWWAVWAEIMNNWHSDYLDNRKIHYFIKA